MIELNKKYNTKTLAEALEISYGSLRNKRIEYEEHLDLFYFYTKEETKKTIYYIFTEQKFEYIPYREFQKLAKRKSLVEKTIWALDKEPRNTGSNVARMILKEYPEEKTKQSTLTIYTRKILNKLVSDNYYIRSEYQWCETDYSTNSYRLLEDEEVIELRKFIKEDYNNEEENINVKIENKEISKEEGERLIGKKSHERYIKGLQRFKEAKGFWPIKVPTYTKNACAPTELADIVICKEDLIF